MLMAERMLDEEIGSAQGEGVRGDVKNIGNGESLIPQNAAEEAAQNPPMMTVRQWMEQKFPAFASSGPQTRPEDGRVKQAMKMIGIIDRDQVYYVLYPANAQKHLDNFDMSVALEAVPGQPGMFRFSDESKGARHAVATSFQLLGAQFYTAFGFTMQIIKNGLGEGFDFYVKRFGKVTLRFLFRDPELRDKRSPDMKASDEEWERRVLSRLQDQTRFMLDFVSSLKPDDRERLFGPGILEELGIGSEGAWPQPDPSALSDLPGRYHYSSPQDVKRWVESTAKAAEYRNVDATPDQVARLTGCVDILERLNSEAEEAGLGRVDVEPVSQEEFDRAQEASDQHSRERSEAARESRGAAEKDPLGR